MGEMGKAGKVGKKGKTLNAMDEVDEVYRILGKVGTNCLHQDDKVEPAQLDPARRCCKHVLRSCMFLSFFASISAVIFSRSNLLSTKLYSVPTCFHHLCRLFLILWQQGSVEM